jgi:hypothetical protein
MKKLSTDEIINELSANELTHVIGACKCTCTDPFIPLNLVSAVQLGEAPSLLICRQMCSDKNMDVYECR